MVRFTKRADRSHNCTVLGNTMSSPSTTKPTEHSIAIVGYRDRHHYNSFSSEPHEINFPPYTDIGT
jgi:C1A family cysteine protease